MSEDEEMPIIDKTSTYFVEDRLIYEYNNENGTLMLDIGKRQYRELLKNLGDFSKGGASFCFHLPQIGEVCFTGVHKIERLTQEEGFIKRITRILRGKD